MPRYSLTVTFDAPDDKTAKLYADAVLGESVDDGAVQLDVAGNVGTRAQRERAADNGKVRDERHEALLPVPQEYDLRKLVGVTSRKERVIARGRAYAGEVVS